MDLNQIKFRKFIGPAQFGGVLGHNKYLSAHQIRSEIENGYKIQDNQATQYGKDLEPVALYYYQKLYNVTIQKPRFVVDICNRKIGGICDGLIDQDTGIEIKCHTGQTPLRYLPYNYLIQMAGYLFLYGRQRWILFSCTFKPDHTLDKYQIFEVKWDDVKDRWTRDWYPKLLDFANSVTFSKPSTLSAPIKAPVKMQSLTKKVKN